MLTCFVYVYDQHCQYLLNIKPNIEFNLVTSHYRMEYERFQVDMDLFMFLYIYNIFTIIIHLIGLI